MIFCLQLRLTACSNTYKLDCLAIAREQLQFPMIFFLKYYAFQKKNIDLLMKIIPDIDWSAAAMYACNSMLFIAAQNLVNSDCICYNECCTNYAAVEKKWNLYGFQNCWKKRDNQIRLNYLIFLVTATIHLHLFV